MLMVMNLLLSICFIFLNHPMSMGLILLFQTILIAMITGMLNVNFWFSYILFLIMIGGMLILFIYMTSIASNEMFAYSNKIMLFMIASFMIMTTLLMFLDWYFMNLQFIFNESTMIQFNNQVTNLTKYFNYPSMFMILFMIMYLFITLIAVVKITKIEFGPLRQKF